MTKTGVEWGGRGVEWGGRGNGLPRATAWRGNSLARQQPPRQRPQLAPAQLTRSEALAVRPGLVVASRDEPQASSTRSILAPVDSQSRARFPCPGGLDESPAAGSERATLAAHRCAASVRRRSRRRAVIGAAARTSSAPRRERRSSCRSWALVVGFVAAELLAVEIESRSEAHSVNFVEITYVAALAARAHPIERRRSRGCSAIVRRDRARSAASRSHKLLVNVALFGVEAAVACVGVPRAHRRRARRSSPAAWPVIFAATLAGYLRLDCRRHRSRSRVFSGFPGRRMIHQVLLVGGIVAPRQHDRRASSSWARSGTSSYSGLLVIGVVGGVLFVLYRAYTRLTERHKNLETLHDFTRSLGDASRSTSWRRRWLAGPGRSCGASTWRCCCRRSGRGCRPAGCSCGTRRCSAASVLAGPADVGPQPAAARATRPGCTRPGEPLPGWLGEIGVKDAAIVPLTTDGVTVGAMVVANRLTEVSSFVEDDLRLFETLANHANVALANGRLVATLQHDAQEKAYQALHDPVTGLPNRTMLQERLETAIAEARASELRRGARCSSTW